MLSRARSTISSLDVAEHDRHLEAAQEERRELRRHQPRADDADLLHAARLAPAGSPTRFFVRRSTRS